MNIFAFIGLDIVLSPTTVQRISSLAQIDDNNNNNDMCETGEGKREFASMTVVKGNAERLPFNDETFDVVLNVESSHLYTRRVNFVREVHRVLKTGGFLCTADVRYKEAVRIFLTDTPNKGRSRGQSVIIQDLVWEFLLYLLWYSSGQY